MDFIEQWFGISPDGGDGSLELLWLGAIIAAILVGDAAASGCDYVLHVASPVAVSEPKNADELIVPARDGTRRAVGAALKAGVKRVVLTSSVAAASPRSGARESVSDETVWTNLDDLKVSAYSRSKTFVRSSG